MDPSTVSTSPRTLCHESTLLRRCGVFSVHHKSTIFRKFAHSISIKEVLISCKLLHLKINTTINCAINCGIYIITFSMLVLFCYTLRTPSSERISSAACSSTLSSAVRRRRSQEPRWYHQKAMAQVMTLEIGVAHQIPAIPSEV